MVPISPAGLCLSAGTLKGAGNPDLEEGSLIRQQGPDDDPVWERYRECHPVDIHTRCILVGRADAGEVVVLVMAGWGIE